MKIRIYIRNAVNPVYIKTCRKRTPRSHCTSIDRYKREYYIYVYLDALHPFCFDASSAIRGTEVQSPAALGTHSVRSSQIKLSW